MRFRQTVDGKNVYLSVADRQAQHNPLYKAWKTKSFTDGDITLHFILLDVLGASEEEHTMAQLTAGVDAYMARHRDGRVFDESTVRKKLSEYIAEGIVTAEKRGRTRYYRRAAHVPVCSDDALHFFSEVAPCGVIGSFLLDKGTPNGSCFSFKHHYITGAMDSEVLCTLFEAMGEKRAVLLTTENRRKEGVHQAVVVPLRVLVGVQTGRQYVAVYVPDHKRITAFRLDSIVSVQLQEPCADFDALRQTLREMLPHMWGVSTQSDDGLRMEHVEFTVRYGPDEQHIPKRLEREKRCGTVEHLDACTSRFTADVYNAGELVPWVRTFICRITHIAFSNKALEAQFASDLRAMYALYGVEGGDEHVVQ